MNKKKFMLLIKTAVLACFFTSCGEAEEATSSTTSSSTGSGAGTEATTEEGKLTSITETEKISLIALGNEDVPVGRYGKEILEAMSIWEDLEGKISYASNVKEVLTQVELGSVDCGIVYRTDANSSDNVEIVETLDSSLLESPVTYPAAMVATSAYPAQTAWFLDFLTTEIAHEIFLEHGFTVIGEATEAVSVELEPCTLTIFAAASLTESITVLCENFQEVHEGMEFLISFDSSGTLATQIEYGAEADIFLSASTTEMIRLIESDFIKETDSFSLLENEVVLIRGK